MPFSFLFGGLLICMFIATVQGYYKSWYITRPVATMFHPNMVYGMLPLGLFFIYLSVLPILPNFDPESFLSVTIAILLIIATFSLMVLTPAFLQPSWLKILELEYGYCLPVFIEEARQMGRWKWDARVRTPKQMQSWIDEVMINRKDDIDELWSQYRRFMREEFGKGNYYIPEHRRPT